MLFKVIFEILVEYMFKFYGMIFIGLCLFNVLYDDEVVVLSF